MVMPMRNNITKIVHGQVPKEQQKDFNRDLVHLMYRPTLMVALLIVAVLCSLLMVSIITPDYFGAHQRLVHYRIMYGVLLGITLGCIGLALATQKKMERMPGIFVNLAYFYGAVICFWAGVLNAFERLYSDDISVLIYIYVFVAVLVVMKPWRAFLLYTANFFWYWVWLYYFKLHLFFTVNKIINAAIVAALSITIAWTLYEYRARNFIARQIILSQKQEIQGMNSELNKLVLVDELTKLYNRRFYDESLPVMVEDARGRGKPIVVMMLDIDYFKQYNDAYGHQAGDACLQAVARLVREVVRASEYAFVRYGGEEFLLVLVGVGKSSAIHVAGRICGHIADQAMPNINSPLQHVTVSIGMRASTPDDSTSIVDLVADADKALYKAKNEGRNKVVMYE